MAAAEGADIVEVAASGTAEEAGSVAAFVAAIRDGCPELVIGVRTGRREVARAARAAGADLLRRRLLAPPTLSAAAGRASRASGWPRRRPRPGRRSSARRAWPPAWLEAGVEAERIVVCASAAGPVAEVAEGGGGGGRVAGAGFAPGP